MSQLRYKGKLIKPNQLAKRMQIKELGSRTKKKEGVDEGTIKPWDMQFISTQLQCKFCSKRLSIESIEKDIQRGWGSVLMIRCKQCLLLNKVYSSHQHEGIHGKKVFDINTKIALGALHAGIGCEAINKFAAVVGLPSVHPQTFKKHEREIGPIVEKLAKENCSEACKVERILTLQNLDKLKKLLPNDCEPDFLTPGWIPEYDADGNCTNDTNKVVRILASYDMCWSKRGNGRQYDSLNGFATLIGKESGLILDYVTFNRKCLKCELGQSNDDHDCRMNFSGTAKAMEPAGAVAVSVNSQILKINNLQLGVFIGDNDSSSIFAVRNSASHTVYKLSDANHNNKGVKNLLYKIDKQYDPERELKGDVINYLHRCFTYAVAQAKGDVSVLQATVENIPFHVFNIHDSCGAWCRFHLEKDSYEHRSIPGGLKNKILFEHLKKLFKNLGSNAQTYASAASSQSNESVNNIFSRKSPKAICNSRSESADFRAACTVLQKNQGESYVADVLDSYNLYNHSNLYKRIDKVTAVNDKKTLKIKTPEFKRSRIKLRNKRSQLKTRKEKNEGSTYQSNYTLALPASEVTVEDTIQEEQFTITEDLPIVFFDLETSGFARSDDILQIALKCQQYCFNQYVLPTKNISSTATEIHGISFQCGDLFCRGEKITSKALSLKVALLAMLKYLQKIGRPCILLAHNCSFDRIRLITKLRDTSLINEFEKTIYGFVDSLILFKKKFPDRKRKNQCTLTTLATETMNTSVEDAHNAFADIILLEQLVTFHLDTQTIIENVMLFQAACRNMDFSVLKNIQLGPLNKILSDVKLKKLYNNNITYESLVNLYKINESDARDQLRKVLTGKNKSKKTDGQIDEIVDHLRRDSQTSLSNI